MNQNGIDIADDDIESLLLRISLDLSMQHYILWTMYSLHCTATSVPEFHQGPIY